MKAPDRKRTGAATDLPGLAVTPVARDGEARFRALMEGHHCPGAPSRIGRTVWCAAGDGGGAWPALAAFPAAAPGAAGAPSSSAAAPGDVRGSGPPARDGLPRREPDARRRDRGPSPPPRRTRRRTGPEAGPAAAARRRRPEPAPRPRAGGGAPAAWSREDEEDERGRGVRNPGLPQGRRGRPPRGRRAPPPHRVPAGALHGRHALRGDGMAVGPRMDPGPGPAMPARFRCRRTGGARQRPGICRIRSIMVRAGPGRPARATARFRRGHGRDQGAGIAADARTVRGAVGGGGRQTHAPGAGTHGASAPLAQKNRPDRRRWRGEGSQRDRRPHPGHGPGPGHRRTHRHRRRPSRPDRNPRLPAWPGRPLHAPRQGQPEEPARGDQGPLRPAVPGTGGLRDPPAAAGARADRAARDPGLHGSGGRDPLPVGRAGPHGQADRPGIPPRAERKARDARAGPSAGTVHGITGHTPGTAGAGALPAFSRAHRSCGNRVHRILDDQATWNGDRCRVRGGHGPENLGCLRRLAIGPIPGRGRPVAPPVRDLNRNPRPVPGWLRPVRNTQPRAKSTA